jgi:hypothetical protein
MSLILFNLNLCQHNQDESSVGRMNLKGVLKSLEYHLRFQADPTKTERRTTRMYPTRVSSPASSHTSPHFYFIPLNKDHDDESDDDTGDYVKKEYVIWYPHIPLHYINTQYVLYLFHHGLTLLTMNQRQTSGTFVQAKVPLHTAAYRLNRSFLFRSSRPEPFTQ